MREFDMKRLVGRLIAFAAIVGSTVTIYADAQTPASNEVSPRSAQEGVYIIGPGDVLKVVVLRNADLSSDAPVRPDGKISLPLIKDMDAVGKTPTQLAHDIETALQAYVRAPEVNVIVSQAKSIFSQVKIVGQGVVPKALPYRNGMRVLDVIVETGGLTQYAAGNRAQIVRTVDGKTVRMKVRLDDLMNRGDTKQNFPMQPGDILVIPEARF
jgi:polysaccharide biosynthesis/export protein